MRSFEDLIIFCKQLECVPGSPRGCCRCPPPRPWCAPPRSSWWCHPRHPSPSWPIIRRFMNVMWHLQFASVCLKSQRSSNDLPGVHLRVLRLQLLPAHVGHPAPGGDRVQLSFRNVKGWRHLLFACHQLDNYCELLCFTAILPPSASLRRNETNLDILCKVKKFLSNLLLFATKL